MKKKSFSIIIINKSVIISFVIISVIILSTALLYRFNVNRHITQAYTVNPGSMSKTDNKSGKLAIVIDDFGEDRNGIDEMMQINEHLTFAVMPFLTYSKTDAETAHEKGYEVIVHLPMEANNAPLSWVGPKPILASMNEDKIKQITNEAVQDIPYAVGANIHMGSKASSDEHVMASILSIIKSKGLFFVDSKTGEHSVVKKMADSQKVKCYERDVFLDNNKSKSYITGQLREAARIALKNGSALAIGHVGVEGGKITAESIKDMIPEFERENVKLVFVSELMK